MAACRAEYGSVDRPVVVCTAVHLLQTPVHVVEVRGRMTGRSWSPNVVARPIRGGRGGRRRGHSARPRVRSQTFLKSGWGPAPWSRATVPTTCENATGDPTPPPTVYITS